MKFFGENRIHYRWAAVTVALLIGVLVASGWSQEYQSVYAITDVTIVVGDGKIIDNGTVLIRHGLIAGVGADVDLPADAEVIDGTGITVYPGFIDLHTSLGFITPSESDRDERQEEPPARENAKEPKTRVFDPNLRPDRIALDLIDFSDENFTAAHDAGITAAVTVSDRGVFPGKGSFVNTYGDDPVAASIKNSTFQFIQYRQVRGGYPSTLFGVVAFQRQKLIDAKYFMEREDDFKKDARSALNSLKKRLVYDPALRNLFPVVAGIEQVVIAALQENDIKRAVELAHFENTFHLNYILSGVTEGYRVVDLLKRENRPLIISLNFPEPDKTTGYVFNVPIKPYEPPAAPGEKKEKDTEKSEIDIMVEEQIHGNAAALYQAGLTFALSSGGNYKDFIKNLRLAVKAGLPADVALAAITRKPAEMLGLSEIIGTVELGKIANLVGTDSNLFDEKAKIKMVFIDGVKLQPSSTEEAVEDSANIGDRGDMTFKTPEGEQITALILKVSGSSR